MIRIKVEKHLASNPIQNGKPLINIIVNDRRGLTIQLVRMKIPVPLFLLTN